MFDAGDDTSTGSTWEAFSLDSLDAAFDDGPYADSKWAVTGNHDHGSFVGDYLADHGWTMLDGEAVDGPAGTRLLGVGDPRSSGLGSWRDESGLSFDEVADRLADAACQADEDGERITTILVHDANMGDAALERGCTDLVVGGHLHVQSGPTEVTGENGAGRLQLHDRHHRRRGVRHRRGRRDPSSGRHLGAHLPRRPSGRRPAGHPRHERRVHGRRLRRAGPVRG